MDSTSTQSVTFFDFLDRMRNPASLDLVRSIKSFIVSFSFYTANPENDGKKVQDFFFAMEAAIKDHPLWDGASNEEIDSSMEGLEKYVMTKLFARTFAPLPEDAKYDQEISEKICLLQTFLRPEHLDIPAVLQNEASWLLAEKELQKINAFKSPREKLLCIMNCCRVINNLLLNASRSENVVLAGADDFLPVLIYVVIKANPPQLHSNLRFIQLYRRQTKVVSEAAYYFTNLVSAKSFIVDLNAKSLSIEETEFEECMQAARLAHKVEQVEVSHTTHNIKASREERGPSASGRIHDDETNTTGELGTVKTIGWICDWKIHQSISTICRTHDMSVILKRVTICKGFLHIDLFMIKSGGSNYPYMEAEAGQLTVGDVERLLSLYKDVVTKYTSLCRAVRHVPLTKKIPPAPHLEETAVLLTQPAETSASSDHKSGD